MESGLTIGEGLGQAHPVSHAADGGQVVSASGLHDVEFPAKFADRHLQGFGLLALREAAGLNELGGGADLGTGGGRVNLSV